ncbi:MAG: Nif11-like leader peptide family RiPP precursor [Candidatus Coproplasma sp.]
MELTNELLEKAKTAKSAEELLEMAKAEGVELSEEEAAKAYADLHKSGELSDDELDNVAGGCDDSPSSETEDSKKEDTTTDRVAASRVVSGKKF